MGSIFYNEPVITSDVSLVITALSLLYTFVKECLYVMYGLDLLFFIICYSVCMSSTDRYLTLTHNNVQYFIRFI